MASKLTDYSKGRAALSELGTKYVLVRDYQGRHSIVCISRQSRVKLPWRASILGLLEREM